MKKKTSRAKGKKFLIGDDKTEQIRKMLKMDGVAIIGYRRGVGAALGTRITGVQDAINVASALSIASRQVKESIAHAMIETITNSNKK